MDKIELVDLKNQTKRIEKEIFAAIKDVIDEAAFINGPAVKDFQSDLENYLNVKHVIPCANGTDALQIALMACGLKPGDEVITPSYTYISTAEVIALLGLTPVFVEVDENLFTINPQEIRRSISGRTRAIIPVHLYGQCANMDEIIKVAKEYNLFVIEDTAQALGADYIDAKGNRKKAGTMGSIGCTSFFPSKNLGCFGDGGAIFTNDDEMAKKIRMISNHGQSKKYYHDKIGVNSRLDTLQAAILKIKLEHLNEYRDERQRVAAYYDSKFKGLPNVSIPARATYSNHVFHQYTLKLKDTKTRDALMSHLAKHNVPSNIYYPLPIHKQKGFLNYPGRKGNLELTENLCGRVLSLPIHTELSPEQLELISSSVLSFFSKTK